MTDATKQYPPGTAYHEAAHAVVAWSYGLRVGDISISDDDASGKTQIDDPGHLPLADQVAIRAAGIAAEKVFGHPVHDQIGFADRAEILRLFAAHNISEEIGDGKALRDLGYQNAKARLEEHRDKVIALAERLIEDGQINEAEVQQLMA